MIAAGGKRHHRDRAAVRTSLEHALLGLIAEQRALSGYDLVRLFDLSTSHYWHAHHGQIYPTLEQMRRRGWIRSRDVIQRGRPNKRLYSITPAGQQELIRWLEGPPDPLRLKDPPTLRCRFLGQLGAEQARAKLLEQRALFDETLASYRAIEKEFFGAGVHSNVNEMFSYFTLRRGIQWLDDSVKWCDWAVAGLERNRRLFEHPSARKDSPLSRAGG